MGNSPTTSACNHILFNCNEHLDSCRVENWIKESMDRQTKQAKINNLFGNIKRFDETATVPTFISSTKCVGSPGLIHDRTPGCHPVPWVWVHG